MDANFLVRAEVFYRDLQKLLGKHSVYLVSDYPGSVIEIGDDICVKEFVSFSDMEKTFPEFQKL